MTDPLPPPLATESFARGLDRLLAVQERPGLPDNAVVYKKMKRLNVE